MKLQRILPFAKQLLEASVNEGDYVIDATIGNGHDTVYLAKLIGKSGHVYGYDIQEAAIANTKKMLKIESLEDRVTLFHQGHQHIFQTVPKEKHGEIAGAIFNLGYLPGGDKAVVTIAETTIEAIEQLLAILKPEGLIVLVIYHGHKEGQIERDKVMNYVQAIDPSVAHVLKYQFINKNNHPPFIVAIEKC